MDDLISRKAALDAIDGIKPMQGNMEQLAIKALCWAAVKIIQPVDAAPVRRGQWLTDGDRLYCSSCEGTQINEVVLNGKQIYYLDIGEQMKYCGKCGARMNVKRGYADGR